MSFKKDSKHFNEQFHRTHLSITTIESIKLWTTLSRFLDYKPLLYDFHLSPRSGSVALRQLNPIFKKRPLSFLKKLKLLGHWIPNQGVHPFQINYLSALNSLEILVVKSALAVASQSSKA